MQRRIGSGPHGPAMWVRAFLHAIVVIFAVGSLGADCSPSPPACSMNALVCPAGQFRVCVNNRCAPVMGVGQACVLDPCASTASLGVCNNGLTCVPGATAGQGTCATWNGSLGCDPTLAFPSGCPSGTWCQKRVAVGATCGAKLSVQGTSSGVCVSAVPEGSACDADWNSAGTSPPICARCEPGTRCVKAPGESTGVCRRTCNNGSNCPCGGSACVVGPDGTKFCDACAATGQSCVRPGPAGNLRCCDTSLTCSTNTGLRCCRPSGTCTSAAECCGGACVSGSCQTCIGAGGAASSAEQCCAGLMYAGGQCKRSCPTGYTCNTGLPGLCAAGRVEACDGFGAVTTCTPVTLPSDELCDGVDNDCNGLTDEGFNVGGACSSPTRLMGPGGLLTASCQNGFAPTSGVLLCDPASRGQTVCTAFEGYDFCTACGLGAGASDRFGRPPIANCGACYGTCTGATLCAPNATCRSTTMSGGAPFACQTIPGCSLPLCWTASQVGTVVPPCSL